MSTENEFKNWLRRVDKTFIENLEFGIKACRSIEFILPTKYEILFEFFSENIQQTKGIGKEGWAIIAQLCELNFPSNSVPSSVKHKLIQKMTPIFQKGLKKPKRNILGCGLALLYHDSMWGMFKNSLGVLCHFAGAILNYYSMIVRGKWNDEETKEIERLLEFLKGYLKLMSKADQFHAVITEKLFIPLMKFSIVVKVHSNDFTEHFVSLFSTIVGDFVSNYTFIFQIDHFPRFIVLETIEFYLRSPTLLNDELKKDLVKYLFETLFEKSTKENLIAKQFVLLLVQKYNCEYDEELLEKSVLKIFNEQHVQRPVEVLSVICEVIRLNPIILSKSLIEILIAYMFKRKTIELTSKFHEFLCLVVDMYNRLYQTKVFVIKLNEGVANYLKSNKISKKLKRKLIEDEREEPQIDDDPDQYYQDIVLNALKLSSKTENSTNKSTTYAGWTDIEHIWPVSTISPSIIASMSALVSNLSLSVWKYLLFELSKIVAELDVNQLDENNLFHIDFLSSFLCQYYSGSRLIESYTTVQAKFDATQTDAKNFLGMFGKKILSLGEFNNRLVNDFLKICYHVGNFELMLYYYLPDSIDLNTNLRIKSIEIHSYLSDEEWKDLKNRINDEGRSDTKSNINTLSIQKSQAYILFVPNRPKCDVTKDLLPSTFDDHDQIQQILSNRKINLWFVENLSRDVQAKLIDTVLETGVVTIDDANRDVLGNQEYSFTFAVQIYKKIFDAIHSKKYLAKSVDMNKVMASDSSAGYIAGVLKSEGMAVLEEGKGKDQTKYDEEEILKCFHLLQELDVTKFSREIKLILFGLNTIVLIDLKASENVSLLNMTLECYNQIIGGTYDVPNAIKHFGIDSLIKIFEKFDNTISIFHRLFREAIKPGKETEIEGVVDVLLKNYNKSKKSEFNVEVLLSASQCLTEIVNNSKKSNKIIDLKTKVTTINLNYLVEYFGDVSKPLGKKKLAFLRNTLDGFYATLKMRLDPANGEIDGEIISLIKLYVTNTIDLQNPNTINLAKIAFGNKNFVLNDYNKILDEYWKQLKERQLTIEDDKFADLERGDGFVRKYALEVEFVTILFGQRKKEQCLQLLEELIEDVTSEKYNRSLNLMSIMAGCTFGDGKQLMFADFFYSSMQYIIMKTSVDDLLTDQRDLVLHILTAFNTFITNSSTEKSYSLIDCVISFLFSLKITKFKVTPDNRDQYLTILWQMSELCMNLSRNANLYITKRIPQLIDVIKNILQSICWYGLTSNENYKCDPFEVLLLSKLAHKLEKLVFILKHNINDVRRLVPHLLCYIIQLMISKSNATTGHSQIRTHFTNICHTLIGVGTDKSRGFILRVSNDAGRKVYENLVKEYEKYKQFKGVS